FVLAVGVRIGEGLEQLGTRHGRTSAGVERYGCIGTRQTPPRHRELRLLDTPSGHPEPPVNYASSAPTAPGGCAESLQRRPTRQRVHPQGGRAIYRNHG